MKTADTLMATLTTVVHLMQTDTRFSPDELKGLVAINVIQDAAGDTTKEQDALIAYCLLKLVCQNPNY